MLLIDSYTLYEQWEVLINLLSTYRAKSYIHFYVTCNLPEWFMQYRIVLW